MKVSGFILTLLIVHMMCQLSPILESGSYLSTATGVQNYIKNGDFSVQGYPNSYMYWVWNNVWSISVKGGSYISRNWVNSGLVAIVSPTQRISQEFSVPQKGWYQLDFNYVGGDLQLERGNILTKFNNQQCYSVISSDSELHSIRVFLQADKGTNSIQFQGANNNIYKFSIDNVVLRELRPQWVSAFLNKYQVNGFIDQTSKAISEEEYFAGYLLLSGQIQQSCQYIISFQWELFQQVQGVIHHFQIFFQNDLIFEADATQVGQSYEKHVIVFGSNGVSNIYVDRQGYDKLDVSSFRIRKNFLNNGRFHLSSQALRRSKTPNWIDCQRVKVFDIDKSTFAALVTTKQSLTQIVTLEEGLYILQFDYRNQRYNTHHEKEAGLIVVWNESNEIQVRKKAFYWTHFSVLVKAVNANNQVRFIEDENFGYGVHVDNVALTKQ